MLITTAPRCEKDVWIGLAMLELIRKHSHGTGLQGRIKAAEKAEITNVAFALGQHDINVTLSGPPEALFHWAFLIREVLGGKGLIEDTVTLLGDDGVYAASTIGDYLKQTGDVTGETRFEEFANKLNANYAPKEPVGFAELQKNWDGFDWEGTQKALLAVPGGERRVERVERHQLRGGSATVPLSAECQSAIAGNSDNYHVLVTAEGDTRGLFVTDRTPTSFRVREQQGGTSDVRFSYRVFVSR
jgi:hypothetical protein